MRVKNKPEHQITTSSEHIILLSRTHSDRTADLVTSLTDDEHVICVFLWSANENAKKSITPQVLELSKVIGSNPRQQKDFKIMYTLGFNLFV